MTPRREGRRSWKYILTSILISVGTGLIAYVAFPIIARIPLRALLCFIIGVIVFCTLTRPANIQPGVLISLFALCISYAALTHNISEWKELNESKRPHFRMTSATIERVEDKGQKYIYRVKTTFENIPGQRSARGFRTKAVLIDLATQETKAMSGKFDTVNDIHGGAGLTWSSSLEVDKQLSTQVMGVGLVYVDPVLHRWFKETYVMKWEVANGEFKRSADIMTSDVPERILIEIDKMVNEFYDRVVGENGEHGDKTRQ